MVVLKGLDRSWWDGRAQVTEVLLEGYADGPVAELLVLLRRSCHATIGFPEDTDAELLEALGPSGLRVWLLRLYSDVKS